MKTLLYKKERIESKGRKRQSDSYESGDKSPIKYVFYIIKENRTYDQVLGDMKEGNGDTSLYYLEKSNTEPA